MIPNDLHYDIIFSDFMMSSKIDVSLDKLKEEIYQLKTNLTHSCNRSGRNSFQSNWVYDLPFDELTRLKEQVVEFANYFCKMMSYDMLVDECSYWVNVNPPYGHNIIHTHGTCELVGNFYVQTGKETGTLEVVRNDGSVYNKIGKLNSTFKCEGEEGRFYMMPGHLWHYVSENNSDGDRISVSYNIRLK